MRTLVSFEMRRAVPMAVAGFALVAVGCTLGLELHRVHGHWMTSSSLPLVRREQLQLLWLTSGLAGLALGLALVLRDVPPGAWAWLVHRPVSRHRVFLAKAIAGVVLYSLAAGLPFALACWWASDPRRTGGPFVPSMIVPGLSILFCGLVCLFAGMLAGLRRARWYGSRWIPLAYVFLPTHIVFGVTGPDAFVWGFLALVLLAVAAWGVSQGDRSWKAQPRAGRLALVGCLLAPVIAVQDELQQELAGYLFTWGGEELRWCLRNDGELVGIRRRELGPEHGLRVTVENREGEVLETETMMRSRHWTWGGRFDLAWFYPTLRGYETGFTDTSLGWSIGSGGVPGLHRLGVAGDYELFLWESTGTIEAYPRRGDGAVRYVDPRTGRLVADLPDELAEFALIRRDILVTPDRVLLRGDEGMDVLLEADANGPVRDGVVVHGKLVVLQERAARVFDLATRESLATLPLGSTSWRDVHAVSDLEDAGYALAKQGSTGVPMGHILEAPGSVVVHAADGSFLQRHEVPPGSSFTTRPAPALLGGVVRPSRVLMHNIELLSALVGSLWSSRLRASPFWVIVWALAAWLVARYGLLGRRAVVGWALLAGFVGASALVVLLATEDFGNRERCGACGHQRRRDADHCGRCGARRAQPIDTDTDLCEDLGQARGAEEGGTPITQVAGP